MVPNDLQQHARRWIAAWNSHDLAAILAFYGDDCRLVAPSVVGRWGRADGTVTGTAELARHFARGLELAPDLHMELTGLLRGVGGATILYARENGSTVADVVTFGEDGRYAAVTVFVDKPYA